MILKYVKFGNKITIENWHNFEQQPESDSMFKLDAGINAKIKSMTWITKKEEEVTWLPWHKNHISCTPLRKKPVVSGPYSSCYFAIFDYNGLLFFGHISMPKDDILREKILKCLREKYSIPNFMCFDPMEGNPYGSFICIYMDKGVCYALDLMPDDASDYKNFIVKGRRKLTLMTELEKAKTFGYLKTIEYKKHIKKTN